MKNNHILFFDGASKENPRQVGAGGVILNNKGNIEITYAWSIEKAQNNQAEAYAFLQGTQLRVQQGIQNLIILGYSVIIINHLERHSKPKETKLNLIFARIGEALIGLHKIESLHILCHPNQVADQQANEATKEKWGYV